MVILVRFFIFIRCHFIVLYDCNVSNLAWILLPTIPSKSLPSLPHRRQSLLLSPLHWVAPHRTVIPPCRPSVILAARSPLSPNVNGGDLLPALLAAIFTSTFSACVATHLLLRRPISSARAYTAAVTDVASVSATAVEPVLTEVPASLPFLPPFFRPLSLLSMIHHFSRLVLLPLLRWHLLLPLKAMSLPLMRCLTWFRLQVRSHQPQR